MSNKITLIPKSCNECFLWYGEHTGYYSCMHPVYGKHGNFYGDDWDGKDSEKAFKECPLTNCSVVIKR